MTSFGSASVTGTSLGAFGLRAFFSFGSALVASFDSASVTGTSLGAFGLRVFFGFSISPLLIQNSSPNICFKWAAASSANFPAKISETICSTIVISAFGLRTRLAAATIASVTCSTGISITLVVVSISVDILVCFGGVCSSYIPKKAFQFCQKWLPFESLFFNVIKVYSCRGLSQRIWRTNLTLL